MVIQAPAALLPTLLAGSSNLVDFNKSVLWVSALFVALMLVLKPLLFDPLLRVFEEREKRSDGTRAEARRMQERAGKLLRKYEQRLDEVRRVAGEEREKLRAETTRLEAHILEEAQEATAKMVEEGRREIRERMKQVEAELAAQRRRIAREVASETLGREVKS